MQMQIHSVSEQERRDKEKRGNQPVYQALFDQGLEEEK